MLVSPHEAICELITIELLRTSKNADIFRASTKIDEYKRARERRGEIPYVVECCAKRTENASPMLT